MSLLTAGTILWILLVVIAYTLIIAVFSYVKGYTHCARKVWSMASEEAGEQLSEKVLKWKKILSELNF